MKKQVYKYNKEYEREYYLRTRKIPTRKARFNYNTKEGMRQHNLKHDHNLSIEEYNLILEKQKGVCGICGLPCQTKKVLSIDHNHKTGKIRGLLCGRCNLALGGFRDDEQILKKAIKWIHSKT